MTLLSGATPAQEMAAGQADTIRKAPIRNIVTLPANGIKAIETDGKIMLMSDNGRFVFSGEMYDTWYQESHTTLKSLQDVATKIHLDRMRLDINQLNTITLGTGKKEVVLFVDTQCSYCHALIKETNGFLDEYTFKIVFAGILGQTSLSEAEKVSCAANKKDVLKAVLRGRASKLDQIDNCNKSIQEKTEITKIMFGLKRAPFLIAPNGSTLSGKPQDLGIWLEANS